MWINGGWLNQGKSQATGPASGATDKQRQLRLGQSAGSFHSKLEGTTWSQHLNHSHLLGRGGWLNSSCNLSFFFVLTFPAWFLFWMKKWSSEGRWHWRGVVSISISFIQGSNGRRSGSLFCVGIHRTAAPVHSPPAPSAPFIRILRSSIQNSRPRINHPTNDGHFHVNYPWFVPITFSFLHLLCLCNEFHFRHSIRLMLLSSTLALNCILRFALRQTFLFSLFLSFFLSFFLFCALLCISAIFWWGADWYSKSEVSWKKLMLTGRWRDEKSHLISTLHL